MKLKGAYLYVVIAMCGLSSATVGLITNLAGLFFTPLQRSLAICRVPPVSCSRSPTSAWRWVAWQHAASPR